MQKSKGCWLLVARSKDNRVKAYRFNECGMPMRNKTRDLDKRGHSWKIILSKAVTA